MRCIGYTIKNYYNNDLPKESKCDRIDPMADSTPPEIKPSISERDKGIIDRHKRIKDEYAPGSKLAGEWGEMRPVDLATAQEISETIMSSNILPPPLDSKDLPVLVSLSSNVGLKEKVLAERLGNSYKVISGDMQKERLPGVPNPMMFDASFPPFQPNSIAAMIDFQGAIWHEAYEDLTSGYNKQTKSENLFDIFARLRPSLREGGVIIVDDARFLPERMIGTGVKIDA